MIIVCSLEGGLCQFLPFPKVSAFGDYLPFGGDAQEVGIDGFGIQITQGNIPLGLDPGEGLLSTIRKGMKDRDQVAVPDQPDLPVFFHPGGVKAFQFCPMGRRPEDGSIKHIGQTDIPGVLGLPCNLKNTIFP
jgi:hypothetical protein